RPGWAEGAQEDAGAAEGRRRQPGDAGRAAGRARDAGGKPAEGILLHRSLPRLSDGADPPVEGQARHGRTAAAATLAYAGVEEGGEGVRSRSVGWTTARLRRAHHAHLSDLILKSTRQRASRRMNGT